MIATINRRRQRGMTLPMVAVFIVVLFAFAALAIDLGVLYTARTSAQHAADAGALSGAYVFSNSPNPSPAIVANAAISTAIQNKILGQNLTAADFGTPTTASPCPVTSAATGVCVDSSNRRVTVYISRRGATGIGTFFARAIGWNSVAINTRATAEASNQAGGTHCLKPFYIANTSIAPASDTNATAACSGQHYIFDSKGNLTPYAQANLGTEFVLRPSVKGNNTPSQYSSLDFGSGGSTYTCTISHCLNDPSCKVDTSTMQNFSGSCGQTLMTQNGFDKQNTINGIDNLIGSPQDGWWTANAAPGPFYYCPSDPSGTCATPTAGSNSLITSAVYDDCPPNALIPPGKKAVNFVGFMQIFVESVDGKGAVTARFVNANTCGAGSGLGNNTGPGGVPIRLIQGP